MHEDDSTSTATFDLDVDPVAAFGTFTDDYDRWWGNGPIDGYATWRLVGRHIEPGVGGRLVEQSIDDQRVLATITEWEPPAGLSWTTPEGVTLDVTFAPHGEGTRVTMTATVPAGVDRAGSLSTLQMAPQWLPRHLARQRAGRSLPELGRLNLILRSPTPAATARWLVDAFGFESTADLPIAEPDPERTWLELRVGAAFVVVQTGGGPAGSDASVVFVDDLDAHLAHAQQVGAEIVAPITEHGFRSYTARDCEGRTWVFAQSGPRVGRGAERTHSGAQRV
jgi:hypothetical protein